MALRVPRPRRAQGLTHAERLASTDGYFAPGSVIRRVGNTPVTPFLGGGTAVLLQLAHPLVATGVSDHSAYAADLWKRLLGTLRALYLITFGTRAEADRAGEIVQAVHARVRGETQTALGPFPAGTRYSAEDPELMLWVHSTLVYASLSAYQRFEHKLSLPEQESYYQDMATVARIFGTPGEVIPPTLAEFSRYFSDQIAGPEIIVTRPAREIASEVLRAPLPAPLRLLGPAHRIATAAQLPPTLRDEYGLQCPPLSTALLPVLGQAVRMGSWPILRFAGRLHPIATRPASTASPDAT
jgi:uncharacterized protein (DUF2236 family)